MLEAALDAAGDAATAAVLVAGPAGIGKTRLLAELAAIARARGATVLTGRCIQLIGSGLPYLPLVEALRPLRDAPPLSELAGGSRLRLFEERAPCSGGSARTRRSCSCSRICTGRTSRRSTSSPTSRTPSRGHRILLFASYRSDGCCPATAAAPRRPG